jgi:hypothetical protein
MLMVGNAFFNVHISEVPQPLTGKIRALKAPGHFVLTGTLAEARTTLNTRGHHLIRMTPVTVNFLNSKTVSLGTFF